MAELLRDLDTAWMLVVVAPALLAVASWALQLASGFCAVKPPEFWHAVLTIIAAGVANVALRLILLAFGVTQPAPVQALSVAFTTAIVVALSLPTGPISALTITIVQAVICVLVYLAVGWVGTHVIVPTVA
ncbi:MAG: hypothetical protein AAF961_05750 [Planctomycetota bacterium]